MDIRERIKQVSNKPVETEIEGLGKVFIRRITLAEADELRDLAQKQDKRATNPFELVARFLGDETNKPIFDPAKPDDLAALRSMPSKVALDIVSAGQVANGPSEKKT